MKKQLINYAIAIGSLGLVYLASSFAPQVFAFLGQNSEHELLSIFFVLAVILILSFVVFYISNATKLPSFVIAIFFGMAAHNALASLTEQHQILGAIVGFGATLILFGGGLETPFKNFKKLFLKIFLLSFPGLLLTAFLFSFSVLGISQAFGTPLPMIVAVLLGAVLASTDPAAIIPVLKALRFNNRATKDIIISESAVTDVTGTLLTVTFLALVAKGANYVSVTDWYSKIFTLDSGVLLLRQIVFGILFGVIGFACLELLQRVKRGHEREFEADSAFFLFIPVVIFTIALALGGSGYLAAFIAGLLFHLKEHLHETERFFNHIIEAFFKPIIFILLGALVNPHELIAYAGIGIAVSVVFMFVIRPITVGLMLAPFTFFGRDRMSWRELLFISFVRETGAIPAVLMVTIASLKFGDITGLVAIGMWVILLTLIVEPILTPTVARILRVAEPITDTAKVALGSSPLVVLGTRGRSFIERLPIVARWALKHGIDRVTILLCLEDKYSETVSREIEQEALVVCRRLNETLMNEGQAALTFSFLSRTGFLQKNIDELSTADSAVTAIFVGRKMLDYRLNEIRQLHVPIYFIE